MPELYTVGRVALDFVGRSTIVVEVLESETHDVGSMLSIPHDEVDDLSDVGPDSPLATEGLLVVSGFLAAARGWA